MAIKFSGEFTSALSPEQVYDFLSDPNKFGPLLPEFQSMSLEDPTHFTVKVNVGVAHIRGTAEIKMELSEAVRGRRALYKGHGNAVGSQITLHAGFNLSPASESTHIAWQGEATIFGKLASLGGGLLEPLAGRNITKLIDGLKNALADPQLKHTTAVGTMQSVQPETATDTTAGGPDKSPDTVEQAQARTATSELVEAAVESESRSAGVLPGQSVMSGASVSVQSPQSRKKEDTSATRQPSSSDSRQP
jgi:carbon monoxide dehydrogenase subunit G